MNLRAFYSYNFHTKGLFGTDLRLFELSVWIQSFAQSLISVFVPIILWRLGLSIRDIVVFFLVFNIIDVPLNIVAQKFIENYGAKWALIVSIFAEVIYLIIFFNLKGPSLAGPNWTAIIIMAAFFAIFDAFYWISHLYIFVQAAHHKSKMRKDVSVLNIIRTIGGLLAPAIGAYILIFSDYKALIFISTLLMFGSLIPLFRMRHLQFKPEQKSKSFSDFFKQPLEKINYSFSMLSAIQSEVEDVIWPFFIFFVFASLKAVAYIPILISFGGLILTYFTGRYSIKKNIYNLISYGALSIGIIWLFRMVFFYNKPFVYLSVLAISFLAIIVNIPLDVATFERGQNMDALDTTTYRNLFRMLARAVLYAILLALSWFVPIFSLSFYIMTAAMLVLFIAAGIVHRRKDQLMLLLPEMNEQQK